MKEIIIDGNNFSTRQEFQLELVRNITKDVTWIDYEKPINFNLDAINDFFRGGFGAFDSGEEVELIWQNSEKSKKDLGQEETVSYLKDKLKRCHPSWVEKVKQELNNAIDGKPPFLFNEIVELIRKHSHIKLVLK